MSKMFDQALKMIQEERQRQLDDEGYTPENDDKYVNGELKNASDSYFHAGLYYPEIKDKPNIWPWSDEAWKPSNDPIFNLVRSGALAQAERDRLERLPTRDAEELGWDWADAYQQMQFSIHAAARGMCAFWIRQAKPVNVDELCTKMAEGLHVEGMGFKGNVTLMVRMVDSSMWVVKDVEVEDHDPEESVGGTTVWLTIEEF